MTLLNCLLSAWYGLPFISKDNYLVSAINGIGAVIESFYLLIFLIFAAKREKAKIIGLLLSMLAIFTTVALLSALAFDDMAQKQQLCGYAAMVCSIIMYASPLSVMRTVIKSKSVEYMPFPLSLCAFLCGTSWFIYGLIGKDKFLYIPNGFGSVLGTMQLILYAIYRNNKGSVETTKPITVETMEMGLPPAKAAQLAS
ncbi:bidirectional sugar transporter sweet1 [Phtheirospermum japonicum]|uniref:Bidirectional sugar transporter sweet1 n=1 Tax=Phtheirospermum japonicum TaxID=374723 RepID=A0A830D2G7_9LAMI|nr:bidirectional sugar transporter sweet1 [Phtheirospermum japonicum]